MKDTELNTQLAIVWHKKSETKALGCELFGTLLKLYSDGQISKIVDVHETEVLKHIFDCVRLEAIYKVALTDTQQEWVKSPKEKAVPVDNKGWRR